MSLLDNYLYLDNYSSHTMNLMRRCSYCGLEAYTEEDLEKFTKAKKYKYGRRNICKKCFAGLLRKGGKYHKSHAEASRIWYSLKKDKRKKRITMKNKNGDFKRIYVDGEPRNGTCSECGSSGKTHIHHDRYDPDNPLEHTRELCKSCHTKFHNAERKLTQEVET